MRLCQAHQQLVSEDKRAVLTRERAGVGSLEVTWYNALEDDVMCATSHVGVTLTFVYARHSARCGIKDGARVANSDITTNVHSLIMQRHLLRL